MIGGASGQGQRDKSRAKAKASSDAPSTLTNLPNAPNVPISDEATAEPATDGAPKIADDGKSAPRYRVHYLLIFIFLENHAGASAKPVSSFGVQKVQ